jgi:hypothetical protein
MKMKYVRVTFRTGEIKIGELVKQENDIFYVKIGNDPYKFYQGVQQIEVLEMPNFDANVLKNSKGKEIGWMRKKAEQAKKYWKLFIEKGYELEWKGYTVWFTFKNMKGLYQARDLQKLLKQL